MYTSPYCKDTNALGERLQRIKSGLEVPAVGVKAVTLGTKAQLELRLELI